MFCCGLTNGKEYICLGAGTVRAHTTKTRVDPLPAGRIVNAFYQQGTGLFLFWLNGTLMEAYDSDFVLKASAINRYKALLQALQQIETRYGELQAAREQWLKEQQTARLEQKVDRLSAELARQREQERLNRIMEQLSSGQTESRRFTVRPGGPGAVVLEGDWSSSSRSSPPIRLSPAPEPPIQEPKDPFLTELKRLASRYSELEAAAVRLGKALKAARLLR
jgi:hypothetical protein